MWNEIILTALQVSFTQQYNAYISGDCSHNKNMTVASPADPCKLDMRLSEDFYPISFQVLTFHHNLFYINAVEQDKMYWMNVSWTSSLRS